jgi:uncharacterized damage-inducible protein DinB
MSIIDVYKGQMEWNRMRTIATLDDIAKQENPAIALGYRPGPGRAHIAWQLMHVAVTEELFATERLIEGAKAAYPDLVPRFKGGSTPDDDIPEIGQIREVLTESRKHVLATLDKFTDADLSTIFPFFKERGWTFSRVLQVLSWHEGHHQGQAHITLNLYKAAFLK